MALFNLCCILHSMNHSKFLKEGLFVHALIVGICENLLQSITAWVTRNPVTLVSRVLKNFQFLYSVEIWSNAQSCVSFVVHVLLKGACHTSTQGFWLRKTCTGCNGWMVLLHSNNTENVFLSFLSKYRSFMGWLHVKETGFHKSKNIAFQRFCGMGRDVVGCSD